MPRLVAPQVSESENGKFFVVDCLTITDSDAVEFLKGLEPPERYKAVSTAVHFGLLALRDFGTITRVDWIDKRFQSFETKIKDTFDDVGEKLEDYLGANGKLEAISPRPEGRSEVFSIHTLRVVPSMNCAKLWKRASGSSATP